MAHFSIRHCRICITHTTSQIVVLRHSFVYDIMPGPTDMGKRQAIVLLAATGMRQGAIAVS